MALAAGLMMSLPFLLPFHRLPLPSFESEWLALVLGLCAAILMVLASRAAVLHLPGVALAPLALAGVVLFQLTGADLAYASNALVFAAFLAWACILHELVGHQRHGQLQPLGHAVQDVFDYRRARVGIDPDLHKCVTPHEKTAHVQCAWAPVRTSYSRDSKTETITNYYNFN